MNNDESSLEKIRNMEPCHAYLVAKGLNNVYAFFTDENLENGPNKALEILYNFSLTQTAIKTCEKDYAKEHKRIKHENFYNLEMQLQECSCKK